MSLGTIGLWIAAGGTLLALLGYGLACRIPRWHRPARFGLATMAAAVVIAAADLLHLILTHRFDIDYVYSYSSTDLPWYYLVSTFWAGQQGTLLLWVLIGAGLGLILALTARSWEPHTMVGFCLIQLYLLALLLIRSPFAPNPAGPVPEGYGLNPLLQNPWMVIHPPTLFLGYASLVLPFAFALAALLRRDYDEWVPRALPWTLFGWISLGGGIILGGYWAYETLGWGGYWAWDPVENASLVPWLLTTALLHGMVMQKATGTLRRTNLALALLSFVAVAYGSYLTRSGVLGEFSVHSFEALSAGFNAFLIGFVLLPLLLGGGLLIWRWRSASSPAPFTSFASRSFVMVVAVVLLCGSAGLITLGMSAPILTGLLLKNAASVAPAFYNWTHAPLAALVAALLCVGGLLAWQRSSGKLVREGLRWPVWMAVPVTLGMAVMSGLFYLHRADLAEGNSVVLAGIGGGFRSLHWALFVGLLLVALGVNLGLTQRLVRQGTWLQSGGHLAHIGLMVMLGGIIASSVFESKQRLLLTEGEPKALFGYTLKYQGTRERADGKTEVLLEVGKWKMENGKWNIPSSISPLWSARPLMFPTRQGLMRNPAIRKTLTHDLYLEPEEIREAHSTAGLRLKKGETAQLGGYTVRFVRFDVPEHMGSSEDFMVGAVLEVTHAGKTQKVVPTYGIREGKMHSEPTPLGAGPVAIQLTGMEAGSGVISLQWKGLPTEAHQPATASVMVTLKPLMSVLWLGCLGLMLGGGVAFYRRLREAAEIEPLEAEATLPTPPVLREVGAS